MPLAALSLRIAPDDDGPIIRTIRVGDPRRALRTLLRPTRRTALLLAALIFLPAVPCRLRAEAREVAYTTPDAFRVLASYYRPEGPSATGVVILPDPSEGRAGWAAVAESLRVAGFHVLVPDLRGTGMSVWQRGVRRDRARFTRSEAANAPLDADAALRYLRDLPETRIRAAAVIGSRGSVTALPDVRGFPFERSARILVSPAPGEDVGRWMVAMEEEAGEMLVILTGQDLNGIDVAASLVPERAAGECWMVDGTERGAALLRTRPDLLHPLFRWIRGTLGPQ